MSVLEQSKRIKSAMNNLQEDQSELELAGIKSAEASAEYDKQLALAIIRLRNGKKATMDGEDIQDPPVSIIDKVAKGICWSYALERDKAQANYKAVQSDINTSRALLNAEQSINKYLD